MVGAGSFTFDVRTEQIVSTLKLGALLGFALG